MRQNKICQLLAWKLFGVGIVFSTLLYAVQSSPFEVRPKRSDNFQTTYLVTAYGIGEPTNLLEEVNMTRRPSSYDDYLKRRRQFLNNEESRILGADISLNSREKLANTIIMGAKMYEINTGFKNPSKFLPSQHIFDVLNDIKSSRLFQLLRRMPKGAVLHAHDTSLCNTDYVVSLTYLDHLWQCKNPTTGKIIFKFSRDAPSPIDQCEWIPVSEERNRQGRNNYDAAVRKLFTLYTENPESEYKDINEVWDRFINIFITLDPIVTFAPVWRSYFKQVLNEFYADGVQYLEFRSVLPVLYDLDGHEYTQADTVQIYYDVLNEFKAENPGFIGSKLIYGPNRRVNDLIFENYMQTIVELQQKFPDFVAGFDLVAQEDSGRPLIDFSRRLLQLPDSVNFFFHAGETNWIGQSTDENLIDAILLGTKRIGHGYAILKHPRVMELVKELDIAIEVNPISNQVLKLNNDNRNHPCTTLFADNYPVVISSDDPSFWEATPLTHDFYIAFLGIASAHADLRTLKKLVMNSITYSSLNATEKEVAFQKWQTRWDEYIEWVIQNRAQENLIL